VTTGAVIKIPWNALSEHALAGVIDDFVNREGTDYGHRDYDIDEKRDAVRRQLIAGRVVITYDPRTRSTSIVPAADLT
jgi:uncharacterized protein YheU (UPF0270 family)